MQQKNLKIILCSLLFSGCIFFSSNAYKIYSKDYYPEGYLNENYLNKKVDSQYILNAGDAIEVIITRELPRLKVSSKIDIDGTINLPYLNRIYVANLTIEELTNLLNKKYSSIIKRPEVNIRILDYRAINIYLKGEVTKPGIYLLNKNKLNNRLFDAIKISNGISNNADLENVQITRINSISNGGGTFDIKVNLLEGIIGTDSTQNVRVYDGDIITIPKSKSLLNSKLKKVLATNLTSQEIKIIISGRVLNQGVYTLPRSSKLNSAIAAAGGSRMLKGKITFIRTEPDGTLVTRKFKYKSNSLKEKFNPVLRNGDIVYVSNNYYNNFSQLLNDITEPFGGIVDILTLKNLID